MPSVQVKNVPAEVHAELTRRARGRGISVQDYVLDLLVTDAASLPLDELFDMIERGEGGRAGGRIDPAVTKAALDEVRR